MNLSLCPICGKLSEEEQTALFSSLDYSTRSFKKGDWVARQGDALSSLYLLSKGRVKTEMITESGTILEVETLSAPTPLASAFLFAENNRFPVDVIALEECEIILIPKSAVMRLLATNEHFLQSYMAFNANRTQFLSERLQLLSIKTIKGKLAYYILKRIQGDHYKQDRNQTELSEYFGVAPPSLAPSFPKTNLANLLMDTLYIGREAIYRRLRGEVPFTLEEAALISRKLGVSLDKIVGVSFGANAVFDLNVVDHDDPFNAYFTILSRYVKIFRAFQDDPTTALGTSSNTIPQTLYLKHDLLSKFRLFKWMYQNKHIQCNHFENLKIPEKLVDTQREFVSLTQYIHSTDYIWDNMIFHHLVNDIKYFSDIHLISCEDIQRIKEELLVLVDELEELAMRGKTEAGNSVRIYVSHINFEATYSYLETSSLQLSMIRVYSINSITTQDTEMFNSLKDWIQSLKKFSTMISESGEMQRIQFFNRQREIINTL